MSDTNTTESAQADAREGLPAFAVDYPNDAELIHLARAYERGDFGGVKKAAVELLKVKSDPEVVKAIHELVARTKPDPLAVALVALTALLLLALSGYWMLHDGPDGPRPPAAPTSH